MAYVTPDELMKLFRPLSQEEIERAKALIPVVESSLAVEAKKAGKDLEEMARESHYLNVLKSIVVDIVARTLMTSTNQEPMTQISESAIGYSWSGTFLVPGGGLFIKRDELARLGLRRQKYGVVDFYGQD